jgi:hypothetical protein
VTSARETLNYAYLDGDTPVRFDDTEAWQFIGGEWKPLNGADAFHKAKLLSEAEFNKSFGQLPPLPPRVLRAPEREHWLVLPGQPPRKLPPKSPQSNDDDGRQ